MSKRDDAIAATTQPGVRPIVSAVSSVDNVAKYVVPDSTTAIAIREAVCSLDDYNLTAVKNDALYPAEVPDSEPSHDLASSYAEAELSQRQTQREGQRDWFKSTIGWTVTIAAVILAAFLSWYLT